MYTITPLLTRDGLINFRLHQYMKASCVDLLCYAPWPAPGPWACLAVRSSESWSCFHWHSLKLYINAIPPRGGGRNVVAGFLEEVVAELPKLMRTAAGALGLDSWSGFTCEL